MGLSTGGFPAVQEMPDDAWRTTLQGYVDTVILRDIIERHNITNVALLKLLATTLIQNAASPFSANKFFNDAKSRGYKVSKDSIQNYMDYMQDAFLVFTVPHYSASERARSTNPKKIYAIDTGLIRAVTPTHQTGIGKLFENLVYLDLRRQGLEVY